MATFTHSSETEMPSSVAAIRDDETRVANLRKKEHVVFARTGQKAKDSLNASITFHANSIRIYSTHNYIASSTSITVLHSNRSWREKNASSALTRSRQLCKCTELIVTHQGQLLAYSTKKCHACYYTDMTAELANTTRQRHTTAILLIHLHVYLIPRI